MKKLSINKNRVIEKPKGSIISYIKDIRKIKRSEKPDNKKTKDELIIDNLSFVISVAKQYQNLGVDIEDLISEGNIGLIRAAEKFNPNLSNKFISYAVWHIRIMMLNLISGNSKRIKLPLSKAIEMFKLKHMISELEQKLEREPTIEELAEELAKYEKNDLISMIKSQQAHISINNNANEYPIEEILANDDYDNHIKSEVFNDFKSKLERLLKKVTKKERDIILAYYGIHDELKSFKDAAKYYNLTIEGARLCRIQGIKKIVERVNKEKIKL